MTTPKSDITEAWTKFRVTDYGAMNLQSEMFDANGGGLNTEFIDNDQVKTFVSPRVPLGALENLIMQLSLQIESFIPYGECFSNYYSFWENLGPNFDPFQYLDFEYDFEVKFFSEIDYDVEYNQFDYSSVPTYNSSTGNWDYPILNTNDLVMNEVRTIKIPSNETTGINNTQLTFITNNSNNFVQDAWPGSMHDIGPSDLVFYNTHFDGSNISGCFLTGNQYLCKSWQNINIFGHLTVANGYNVLIESATEINIGTTDLYELIDDEYVVVGSIEGVVEPEIMLQINPNIITINQLQALTPAEVNDFCKNHYYADNLSRSAPYNLEEDEYEIQEEADSFEIMLYPNPTNESTLLTFSMDENSKVELFLTSISGEVLSQTVSYDATPGDFRHLINLQSFENGIYLLVIQINGKRYVKRIVKI